MRDIFLAAAATAFVAARKLIITTKTRLCDADACRREESAACVDKACHREGGTVSRHGDQGLMGWNRTLTEVDREADRCRPSTGDCIIERRASYGYFAPQWRTDRRTISFFVQSVHKKLMLTLMRANNIAYWKAMLASSLRDAVCRDARSDLKSSQMFCGHEKTSSTNYIIVDVLITIWTWTLRLTTSCGYGLLNSMKSANNVRILSAPLP